MESVVAKPRGLFINPAAANCSIYESGQMAYRCLQLSERFTLDYVEVDVSQREIGCGYDFYVFNYHHGTMGWLDTERLGNLRAPKLTFVLEVLPDDPFPYCPPNVFDAYCALDPTMRSRDRLVDVAAERNPDKYGARTLGTDIPIVSEAESRAMNPDYYLVLPWHFKEEFVKREAETLKRGIGLIFPLPDIEVVRQ